MRDTQTDREYPSKTQAGKAAAFEYGFDPDDPLVWYQVLRAAPGRFIEIGKPKAVLTRYEEEEYEALLKKVEDLEDILLVKESLSAPEEEAIGLEDYERGRAGHV